MQVQELYEKVGGDYEGIKGRLRSDEIIKKFLLKFPEEKNYGALVAAVECGDAEEAFAAAHAMKGVVANLSFPKLHEALAELTEQLRPGTETPDKALLQVVVKYYEEIVDVIQEL